MIHADEYREKKSTTKDVSHGTCEKDTVGYASEPYPPAPRIMKVKLH